MAKQRGTGGNLYGEGETFNFRLGKVPPVAPDHAVYLAQQTQDVATIAVPILNTRANRRYLLIQNLSSSASTVWIAFGTVASASNGFELIPGASLEMTLPAPANNVSVVCAAGTASIRYVEG